MIQNLRPRVLNKSASPSVIRSTEMLDAVNIVADGVLSSESNTIKKAPGNIKVYLNDEASESDILGYLGSGETEIIIGSLIDDDNERVFYFSTNSAGSIGSIYLLQQFSEDEIFITLLLRSTKLDFSKEDFVAADILKIPVQNKELTAEGGNFGGIQDDSEDLLVFDDSVNIGDILGEVQVSTAPSSFDVIVNPFTEEDTTYQVNLVVENVGGGIAYNNTVFVGEGTSQNDAVDHDRVSIFLDGDVASETFDLDANSVQTIPIFINVESGVAGGVYDFYCEVLNSAYQQVTGSPISFSVNVSVLEEGVPTFRVQVSSFGTGSAASYSSGEVVIGLGVNGEIEEGSNDSHGVAFTISQLSTFYDDEFVYPSVDVSLSLGEAQQYFEFSANADDNIGTNLTLGAVNGTFPIITSTDFTTNFMSFNLNLITGSAHDETTNLVLDFGGQNVTLTNFTNTDSIEGAFVDVIIQHQVVEAVEVNPANIVGFGFNDNEITLSSNIESNDDLNGSASTLSGFRAENLGAETGYYILDVEFDGGATDEEKESWWNATLYNVGGAGNKRLYSSQLDVEGLLPVGFDLSGSIYEISPETAQNINFIFSNIGDDFVVDPLVTFDPSSVGYDPYVGDYSFLGFPGNSVVAAINLKQVSQDVVNAPNAGNISSAPTKSSADIEITCSSADTTGPLMLFNRNTFVSGSSFNLGGGTNMMNLLFDGIDETDPGSFFMPGEGTTSPYFDFWTQDTVNDLQGTNVSLSIESGLNKTVIFDIANTSLSGGNAVVTLKADPQTAGAPANLVGNLSAGQPQHDPSSSQAFAPVGSIGYVFQWTSPKPISEYSPNEAIDQYSFVNTSPSQSLVWGGAVGSEHEHFGKFRMANISIPAYQYVKVAIIPFYSDNALDVIENLTVNIPGNQGLATKILFTSSGNTDTVVPANLNWSCVVRHPLSEAQRDSLLNSVSGAPAPKSLPVISPDEINETDTSAKVVISSPQETGSTIITPGRTVRSTQSSKSRTSKKRRYGK